MPRLPGRRSEEPGSADGCGFDLYGWLPAEGGMAPAVVVEAFDVLEDRVGELDAGGPALPVEQLGLHAAPERFNDGVVIGSPMVPRESSSPALRARSVKV